MDATSPSETFGHANIKMTSLNNHGQKFYEDDECNLIT
jgi:hypothetical protein